MKAPAAPPGQDDPVGTPRFVLRYTMWYTWPRNRPTRQDLADFMFTTAVACAAAGVLAGAGGILYLLAEGAGSGRIVGTMAAAFAVALAVCALYVWAARRDWRKRQ